MYTIKTILPKAILAGVFINIAATIYLSIPNKIIGSLMFAFGLFAVLVTQSNLYTGMAGYYNYPFKPASHLIVALFGNAIGCFAYSLCYSLTASSTNIQPLAYALCENKFGNTLISIFISSIYCGTLMFLAVDTFKKNKDIIGIMVVILCVSGFIITGFEHSIANISYIALAQYPITVDVIFKVILMAFGNFIGAIIARFIID